MAELDTANTKPFLLISFWNTVFDSFPLHTNVDDVAVHAAAFFLCRHDGQRRFRFLRARLKVRYLSLFPRTTTAIGARLGFAAIPKAGFVFGLPIRDIITFVVVVGRRNGRRAFPWLVVVVAATPGVVVLLLLVAAAASAQTATALGRITTAHAKQKGFGGFEFLLAQSSALRGARGRDHGCEFRIPGVNVAAAAGTRCRCGAVVADPSGSGGVGRRRRRHKGHGSRA